jgi:peroxiredoxin
MVQTPSTMIPIGTTAPDFSLVEPATGKRRSLSEFDAPATVIMFICNHCPFVIHVRDEITRLVRDYAKDDVAFIAINANSLESHPQDGPTHMAELVRELGWTFPFLFDDTQEVAKAYHAACTPDFYVFDRNRRLAYRGQLDEVLAGNPVSREQRPSIGCNIKWKPGNEPDYFTAFIAGKKTG